MARRFDLLRGGPAPDAVSLAADEPSNIPTPPSAWRDHA